MATLHPSLSHFRPLSAGDYRERDVLRLLEDGLAGWDVFHHLHVSDLGKGGQYFVEMDAVALSPGGHAVVVEVKAGEVEVSGEAIVKHYSDGPSDVSRQLQHQSTALISRLRAEGFGAVHVEHLLVLPDQRVSGGTAAFPRERIVDASGMEDLCWRVQACAEREPLGPAVREALCRFLEDRFQVVPDPSVHLRQARQASVRMADGLATWVPRIQHPSGAVVVQATAGSGKTQLALALLRAEAAAGRRAAYVCFNRPLADHMGRLAPARSQVGTFHELCMDHLRRSGEEPDFSDPGVFTRAAERLVADAPAGGAPLDLLVVDEAQDLEATWIEALTARLGPAGRLVVLGDPDQNLYGRAPFEVTDAVTVDCPDNFRSPRRVVEVINLLRLSTRPVQARALHPGDLPGFHVHARGADPMALVEACVRALLAEGYAPDEVAVLSFAGRDRSQLLARDSLAGQRLRRFTGTFDRDGNARWTEGSLLAETVHRFKGQAAPAVVLCEVDFDQPSPGDLRRLFVGFTRAQFRLEVVLSNPAAEALLQRSG